MSEVTLLAVAYLLGSVPFSNIVARSTSGVDLRRIGSGTVSGTGVYRAAGFLPVVVAGLLDIGKGALAAGLAGSALVGALAGGLAVTGHNWSIFLKGSGGRGISPALGATLVLAPEGTVVLGAGLAVGRIARQTGLGVFVAQVALLPVLMLFRGDVGAVTALALLAPMFVKRLTGNAPPPEGRERPATYLHRLAFDHDPATDDG